MAQRRDRRPGRAANPLLRRCVNAHVVQRWIGFPVRPLSFEDYMGGARKRALPIARQCPANVIGMKMGENDDVERYWIESARRQVVTQLPLRSAEPGVDQHSFPAGVDQ